MRRWLGAGAIVSALLMALTPLARAGTLGAQASGGGEGGVRVKGWTGRPDPQAEQQGRRIADARLWSSGDTLHAAAGPPAAYWNPEHVATGAYVVRATFTLPTPPPERETVGLFMGGSDLEGDRRNYLYCALHGDGMFSIKHRYGGELHTLVERKASEAIRHPDAIGRATNTLAWRVDAAQVTCLVNDVPVAAFPRPSVIGNGKLDATDGVYGLRINHNLSVQITGFARMP
jgi:hypothetical protein